MKTVKRFAVLFVCSCFVLITENLSAQSTGNVTQGTYKTIFDMLKDVPGLEVKTNGSTGGGTVTVRGASSFTQGKPVFVVDGTVYEGDLGNINPADVETINVLKDGASGTAYGSRGMFGVVMINTKKGSTNNKAVAVTTHNESAYTYFIDHKTPLKVFGQNDEVMIEGVIQKQKGDSLVFIKKRKDFLIAISNVKRVEMLPQQ